MPKLRTKGRRTSREWTSSAALKKSSKPFIPFGLLVQQKWDELLSDEDEAFK